MRTSILTLTLIALGQTPLAAQLADDEPDRVWSLSAAVAVYVLPDEGNFAQPTFAADRGALHLETRYNYEALRTASLWVGYAMRGGQRVQWELTPMVGAVFGATDGIAPGYLASVSWWKLDAYTEGEYVLARTSDDGFVYHWSEAAIAPVHWLRGGMATQRTRAYETARAIQRAPFVNVLVGRFDAAAFVFIANGSKPAWVLSVGWSY